MHSHILFSLYLIFLTHRLSSKSGFFKSIIPNSVFQPFLSIIRFSNHCGFLPIHSLTIKFFLDYQPIINSKFAIYFSNPHFLFLIFTIIPPFQLFILLNYCWPHIIIHFSMGLLLVSQQFVYSFKFWRTKVLPSIYYSQAATPNSIFLISHLFQWSIHSHHYYQPLLSECDLISPWAQHSL